MIEKLSIQIRKLAEADGLIETSALLVLKMWVQNDTTQMRPDCDHPKSFYWICCSLFRS